VLTANYLLEKLNETQDIGLVHGEAQLNLISYPKAPAWAIELKFTKGKEITGIYYTTGSSGKEVKFYDEEKKAGTSFDNLKNRFEKITSYSDFKSISFPGNWVQPDGKGYPPVDIDGTDNINAKVTKTVSIKIGTKSVSQEKKKAEITKDLRKTITTSTPSNTPTVDRLSREFYQL
jgi:hypothetical protein